MSLNHKIREGVGNRVAVTETVAAPGASVAQATGATAPATLLATTPALYLPGPFLRDAERAPEAPHLIAQMWDWLTQPLPTLARPSPFVSPLLSPLTCPYPPAIDGGRVISYTYDSTARLTRAAYSADADIRGGMLSIWL
ncbi:MAG: hypothetical protein JXA33_21160 [Anaerolineae bacterium]|nr:hypothetical protein [Anaerolineae bacterium]